MAGSRGKLAVAHKWADWLHNALGLGGVQHFKMGETISNGPHIPLST